MQLIFESLQLDIGTHFLGGRGVPKLEGSLCLVSVGMADLKLAEMRKHQSHRDDEESLLAYMQQKINLVQQPITNNTPAKAPYGEISSRGTLGLSGQF